MSRKTLDLYAHRKFFIHSDVQVASKPGSPESLQQLVEMVKNPAANVAAASGVNVGKEDKARQSRDKKVSRGVMLQYFLYALYNFILIQHLIVLQNRLLVLLR